MTRRFLSLFEPFVAMLLGTVLLATLLPTQAGWAAVASHVADAGIVFLFFPVDRGPSLLVVYTAFGAAAVDGLWHKLAPADLALILGVGAVLLALVLAATWAAGRAFGFARPDAIVLQFCGSKKSLASGVPMAACYSRRRRSASSCCR